MPTRTAMETLDHWTAIALESYWKNQIKEAQEANNTGCTEIEETPEF